jgi:hypothetical protein
MPGGNEDPDAIRELRRDFEPRIVHRDLGGGDRVLDEGVHLLDVLLVDPVERIEPAYFARDSSPQTRRRQSG